MKNTQKVLNTAFSRFLNALGEEQARAYNDVGKFNLEHIACYGGYLIERIECQSGSISHPFFSKRLKAAQMLDVLNMATMALELYKNKEK
jgi:hypothetical protein